MLQDGFDYDKEREKQAQLITRLKDLPPKLRTPEARWNKEPELAEILGDGPKPILANYQAINMLKVPDTFNEIVLRWQSLSADQQWQAIAILYQLFAQPENDLEGAIQAWKVLAKQQHLTIDALVTAVQVINPTTGKGTNSSKSDRPTNSGLKSFWLLELLKFKGFMLGAAPYVLKGSKDRKTYVIMPETVELGNLKEIMDKFREICWSSTAVKQDSLTVLRLAQILVKQQRTELTKWQNRDEFDPPPIISIARGFDVTFYKDMRNAHAAMNVSMINLPNWFPSLKTIQDIEEAEHLLEEHIRILRRIEGYQGKEGSEELELLRAYRYFLSGHNLEAFWTFAALYSIYLFRQREREKDTKRWLPQLTKKGLDLLVKNHQNTQSLPLEAILTNKGFKNIASAIREATTRAQYRTSQEKDKKYDVRYGLNQQLLRKARYCEAFADELNEFISLYNTETAREEEKIANRLGRHLTKEDYRTYKLRFPVSTSDMEQLIKLLDSYPTETVAKMLIAYGSCRLETFKTEELQTDAANEIVDEPEQDQDQNQEEAES